MTRIVLQRLMLRSKPEKFWLYWRKDEPGAALKLGPGAVLDLDTYFNSFDEAVWRRHTRLGALTIELRVAGAAHVQLWRHTHGGGRLLLAEGNTEADENITLTVPQPVHPRAAGRLALRVIANEEPVMLKSGAWVTQGSPAPVHVMLVVCTYNRDVPLRELIGQVASDAAVVEAIAGLIIVNNGRAGLPARLGVDSMPSRLRNKLHIVEQENFGGAGGFTRGMLAARDLGASHVILSDDDVVLEPEAILRTIRLYGLARGDFLVGGHMIDLFQPNRLYEAGARLIDERLAMQPLQQGADLAGPGALDRFMNPVAMHYNGWWFMGLPLVLLDRHGWPMPCFIRGDDIEFGRRLHDAGVTTVSMPGIGIWHEPFYAKLGSWHIYYEFRNMMVLASRHFPAPSRLLSATALKWIVAELLTFRYQRAALLIRAVEDFLDGPSIYSRKPAEVHASLDPIRKAYPAGSKRREQVVAQPAPPIGPRNRLSFAAGVLAALQSEWRRPDGQQRAIRIDPHDHLWFRVRKADLVVVDEFWEIEQPVYQRSRKHFRTLFRHMVRLRKRMRREMEGAVREWRDAHARFTTEAAWRSYLDVPEKPSGRSDAASTAPQAMETAPLQ